MIWFTSDTHYNHKNIVRGTTEWKIGAEPGRSQQRVRDFDTLFDHNEVLVENFNELVKPDDVLYHLGDWSFGGIRSIWEFRKQLKCKEIHLILGNHDHHIENNRQIAIDDADRAILPELGIYDDPFKRYDNRSHVNLRDIFASVQHYKEISVAGQRIVLCHYAMRVWNKSHKGAWMLYGHSHGTLDEMKPEFANPTWIGDQYWIKNWRTMDVGVDTNNLKPYSITEIHNIMKNRDVLLEVDHHNTNTN